jgi:uncharacterized protein YndB with AHSA1/START domain
MTASPTDRIEKSILLRSPIARVWSAVSDSTQFGAWFGVLWDGPFVAGSPLHGRIVGTTVDADVARLQEPHAGTPFDIYVERIEALHHLSFRWHPSPEPGSDLTDAPTTLVVFELTPAPGGTLLTVTESGFDAIPLERRASAFSNNERGWTLQVTLIEKYLAGVERS